MNFFYFFENLELPSPEIAFWDYIFVKLYFRKWICSIFLDSGHDETSHTYSFLTLARGRRFALRWVQSWRLCTALAFITRSHWNFALSRPSRSWVTTDWVVTMRNSNWKGPEWWLIKYVVFSFTLLAFNIYHRKTLNNNQKRNRKKQLIAIAIHWSRQLVVWRASIFKFLLQSIE